MASIKCSFYVLLFQTSEDKKNLFGVLDGQQN